MDENKPELIAFIEATCGKLPAWQQEIVRLMEKNPDRKPVVAGPSRRQWRWHLQRMKKRIDNA